MSSANESVDLQKNHDMKNNGPKSSLTPSDSVNAAFCEILDGMHIAELAPIAFAALLARHPQPQLHHANPSTRRGHIGE